MTTTYNSRTHSLAVRETVQIMPAEWRWVIVIATGLILIAFLPLVWMALRGTADWQFMGVLHNYQDGATYIAKMRLGAEGDWLVRFMHTPETHVGAFLQVLYLALGHLANALTLPTIVVFHVARVGASLVMYAALYYLGASIWTRLRSRRLFFLVAVLGSGFGWLLAPLTQITNFPDFSIPEMFPFYSSLMNVHFPLTIALLALLVSIFITGYRPGADVQQAQPTDFRWALIGLFSVLIALLYPQALVPFGAAALLFVLAQWLMTHRLSSRGLLWVGALGLPALPLALYYAFTVTYNPAFNIWNVQNLTPAPPLWVLIAGLGLPLLVALPGIMRAVRRFEADGSRIMLLWLVAMLIALYAPFNTQSRFTVGLMIPIAYFATRALEDFWLPRINRRVRAYTFALLFPLMAISLVFMLFLPMLPVVVGSPQTSVGIFLERDYALTANWLDARTNENHVLLASPAASIWLPAWAGTRVVYGHPFETLDANAKHDRVLAWYNGDCGTLLDDYNVRYVLYGPREREISADAPCLESLRAIYRVGAVTVYAP